MKRSFDIVIVGGGCMGTSTAYHLARRGASDVLLIEREPLLGMGSTGRNAGGVRHQFSHESNVRLSIESIGLLERFKEEVGYEIDFHQHGYLFLLSTGEALELFKRNVAMQRKLGVNVDLLSPEQARELAPGLDTEGVIAATFCGRDGIADPNGVTMGFAKAAAAAGAEIIKNTEVTGINVQGGRVAAVRTTKDVFFTRVVVNAAGPYARNVAALAGIDLPVEPIRRHIFITEPISRDSSLHVPDTRIMVVDFETTFYFHRERGGILFGMSDPLDIPGFNTTVNWGLLEQITPIAVRRLPALAETGIAHAWAGLYEVTPDAMPIIGPVRQVSGFFCINGFSGHGFQHSPAAGRVLADLIMSGRVEDLDMSPFSHDRFSHGHVTGEATMI